MAFNQVQSDYDQLQGLLATFEDLRSFLNRLTALGAEVMTEAAGTKVECAVTLRRQKRPVTIAGSSEVAVRLDEIEQAVGGGPCTEALKTGRPVLLADVSTDSRWPKYSRALAAAGCGSCLGVPLDPGENAAAALNLFASPAAPLTEPMIARATAFAESAGQAMALAVRIAAKDELTKDLRAAMEKRTIIDLAAGIIMGQNRCTQDEAMKILMAVSSNRNQKLAAVAEEVVAGVSGSRDVRTHFDD
ncbi:GAF and ANTAR domain-containing protein [Pseudarthrobacter oxydans]|uniref:GAF and ANTAR domain-containing protein n=1 Tax=Pseudarthrobacter oxydans TaxID=1671 RepID=UPI0035EAD726|nr:GAF and ANTAR domain-containing protein [Pseudarthrobacter oxydans]